MLKRNLILLIIFAACMPAWAQIAPGSGGSVPFIATGGTAARSPANWGADVVNVKDFGATGNGTTDDASAINNAIAYGRTTYTNNGGIAWTLYFPVGNYLVQSSPINLTNFGGRGLNVDGYGATLMGQTSGKAVVDALGTQWMRLRGLQVYGSSTNTPSIGIQIGRDGTYAAAQQSWSNVMVWGNFTFAGVYMFSGETNNFTDLRVFNNYAGGTPTSCFGLVLDGINHWNVPSNFVTQTQTVNAYHSFNENLFIQPHVATAYGCTPVWMANTRRHKWVGGYVASGTGVPGDGGSPNAFQLWSESSADANSMLDLDVHAETGDLTDEILITGPNPTPILDGLHIKDHASEATASILKADTGITSVTARGIDFDFSNDSGGTLSIGSAVMFSQPSLWSVSGIYRMPPASTAWNLGSSAFAGVGMVGASATFSGSGAGLTGLVVSMPSTLTASQISNPGDVSAINLSYAGHYNIQGWCYHTGSPCSSTYAGQFPVITIGAPAAGGSQATAAVTAMMYGTATNLDAYISGAYGVPASGGTGYQVNDVLTMVGGTCTTQPAIKVVTVSSGAVATYSPSVAGSCSVLPTEPISLTGGHGTGATLAGLEWQVASIALTAAGSGYSSTPAVSFQNTNTVSPATGTASLSSVMTLESGNAAITLGPTNTVLGVSGATGSPVLSAGALIDNSGVRQTLTTAGYTVPANTSLVRFIQAGTVATATVTLPTALADGQPIQFVNYAGAVTALTFSPAVNGWTNASTLAAYTGLRVRWDATSAAWYREQ